MDRNKILAKLHKRFPSLPQNTLLTIYKAWSEHMQLLMRNNISADIRWLIEAKVRLVGELPPKFIAYMPGCGKGNYARKRRARRISVACHKCARMSCDKNPCSLGMMSDNREYKIQFSRDGLNKESLDDILLSLETHPSGYVQFKNICVLFGFNYGKPKEFVEAIIDLGRSIAERKLHLVYGGGNRGLSKLVSEAAFFRGSQVLGIISRVLKPLGSLSDSPTGEELAVSAKRLFICAHTANYLLDLLQAYKPEPDSWTFVLERPNNDGNNSRSKKYKLDLTLRL
ncbi:hypothetical protein WN943_011419 [Citrus x changshan-huyou]